MKYNQNPQGQMQPSPQKPQEPTPPQSKKVLIGTEYKELKDAPTLLDPAYNEYIRKQASGELFKEVRESKSKHIKEVCPTCRRPTLKRMPQMQWRCLSCGKECITPERVVGLK